MCVCACVRRTPPTNFSFSSGWENGGAGSATGLRWQCQTFGIKLRYNFISMKAVGQSEKQSICRVPLRLPGGRRETPACPLYLCAPSSRLIDARRSELGDTNKRAARAARPPTGRKNNSHLGERITDILGHNMHTRIYTDVRVSWVRVY